MSIKDIVNTFRSTAVDVAVAGRYVPPYVPRGVVRERRNPLPSVGLTACGNVVLSRFAAMTPDDIIEQRNRVLNYDFT